MTSMGITLYSSVYQILWYDQIYKIKIINDAQKINNKINYYTKAINNR